MDNVTARALCAVNKRFYQRQCASFSTTRTTPWEGWQLCLEWARKARRAEGTQTGDNAGARAAHGDENTAAGIARENGNAGPQIARRSEDAGARAAQEGRNTDAEDADGKGNADARAARGDGSAKVDIARGNEGAGAGAEHESENADEQSDMRRRQGDADAKTLRSEHARPALSVLDLACGNLRFEAFLAKELADTDLAFHTADDCDALVKGAPWRPDPADGAALGNRAAGSIRWHHQSFDVLAALDAEGRSDGAALDAETPGGGPALAEALQTPRCDLAVSFGFLHHIPLPRWREEVLAMLAAKVRPGGFVIVSLMKKKFVDELHYLTEEEMLDMTALAQTAPGAIAVNGAILVGRRIAGIPGLIVAVLATILPPIVIISIISMMYAAFAENEWVRAVLTGMQSGVAAVICDVTANLGGKVVQSKDWLNLLLMAGAFVASAVFHVNVIVVILVAAAIGVIRALLARKGGVSA